MYRVGDLRLLEGESLTSFTCMIASSRSSWVFSVVHDLVPIIGSCTQARLVIKWQNWHA